MLWEDVPNPVTSFLSFTYLVKGNRIIGILGLQETLEIIMCTHIVIVIVTLVVYQISDVLFAYILEFVEEHEEQQEEDAA